MALEAEERAAIIAYRIEKSYQVYQEAVDNAQLGHWSLAAGRLYYSVFHMASALLIDKGIFTRTHAGVISSIGQNFVRNGILTIEDGKLISRLQNMRHTGDYDDMFDWEENDVKPYFEPTKQLLERLKSLITLV